MVSHIFKYTKVDCDIWMQQIYVLIPKIISIFFKTRINTGALPKVAELMTGNQYDQW